MDEAVLLSVGLNPSPVYVGVLVRSLPRERPDPTTEFLRARRDLFRRALDPQLIGRKLTPAQVLGWVRQIDLEVHARFLEMLEKAARAERANHAVDTLANESPPAAIPKIDPREKTSMAKLLLIMAVDFYGYDPRAKRSPVPREIESIAQRNGLDLSAETIRTYLRLGAEHLPPD